MGDGDTSDVGSMSPDLPVIDAAGTNKKDYMIGECDEYAHSVLPAFLTNPAALSTLQYKDAVRHARIDQRSIVADFSEPSTVPISTDLVGSTSRSA